MLNQSAFYWSKRWWGGNGISRSRSLQAWCPCCCQSKVSKHCMVPYIRHKWLYTNLKGQSLVTLFVHYTTILCYCCAQNALVLILLHYYYYYICLMDFFSSKTWVSRHQKGKPFWILLKREKMGWQWHQLDHMQIICTSLQINNHDSTSPFSFLQAGCLSCRPTNSVKALKALLLQAYTFSNKNP